MKSKYTKAFPPEEIAAMRAEAAPYDKHETLDVSAGCFRRLLDAADQRAELLAALRDVIVWTETFNRGECRESELQESINDANALLKKAGAK